jgi:hypothetical protein
MGLGASRQDPLVSDVVKAAVGIGGLALCITLAFLGMRAVMDVGGACADGGPYVSAQSCPDGSTPALLLGIFGLFLFGGVAAVYGSRLGGIWAAAPLFAWSGLFLSLGWNFLEYGLFNPPGDETVIWGWLICGVLFVAMGLAPLLGGFALFGDAPVGRGGGGRGGSSARAGGTGPAMVLQPAPDADAEAIATFNRALATAGVAATVAAPAARRVSTARSAELQAIASGMGAVIIEAAAETPADPRARAGGDGEAGDGAGPDPAADGDFSEGTQALLDRLERLADLRDRALLEPDEYETAKDSVVRELEGRS